MSHLLSSDQELRSTKAAEEHIRKALEANTKGDVAGALHHGVAARAIAVFSLEGYLALSKVSGFSDAQLEKIVEKQKEAADRARDLLAMQGMPAKELKDYLNDVNRVLATESDVPARALRTGDLDLFVKWFRAQVGMGSETDNAPYGERGPSDPDHFMDKWMDMHLFPVWRSICEETQSTHEREDDGQANRGFSDRSYTKSGGVSKHTLANFQTALREVRKVRGPLQVFEEGPVERFCLLPVSAEDRTWLARYMRFSTPAAEYNDGYLGFGSAFAGAVGGGAHAAHPTFAERSGMGIPSNELFGRILSQRLKCLTAHDNIRNALTPLLGGGDGFMHQWFGALLERDDLLLFVAEEDASALLVRKVRPHAAMGDEYLLPVAAVFPQIAALVVSAGDANHLDEGSMFGGLSPHREEPDMRVQVGHVAFYTWHQGMKDFVTHKHLEYLPYSFVDRASLDGAGYRTPCVIADHTTGAYSHFVEIKDDTSSPLSPAWAKRTLVSLHRQAPAGAGQELPVFSKAVRDGNIVCELSTDTFKDEADQSRREMFCTVRWLDSPPTLSGKEYLITPMPWSVDLDQWNDYLDVHTGEEYQTVHWVPGYSPMCIKNPHFSREVEDMPDFLRENWRSLGDLPTMHSTKFLPGASPQDPNKCDPRIDVAIRKWDRDTNNHERVGLNWWRHMERERMRFGCPRSAWLRAWGKWAKQEEADLAKRAWKDRAKQEREERERRKHEEERERQREADELRIRARTQGDMGLELQMREEREHEELLYKRAVLEVVEELNKKWEETVREVARVAAREAAKEAKKATREAKDEGLERKKGERGRAGQDAAEARRVAREGKARLAQEEKAHQDEAKAANRAAFLAEKAERAKEKAGGPTAGVIQGLPQKGKKAGR